MSTKTFSIQTIVVAVFMAIASLLTSCRSSRNTQDMPYAYPYVSKIDLGDLFIEGYVDKDPVFLGDNQGDSLREYIKENMVYPADALKDSIQGVVIVQFTVEKDGSITDVKALKQVHPLLDAEAVRLFSEMPNWEPGKLRDTLRRVRMLRSVHFRMGERGINGSAPSVSTISHEYVDLGLSVKWATCNVGASKPEEYGDYYAWGETEPKDFYFWKTYKYCDGSYKTLTKYTDSACGKDGFSDNKSVLDPEDDVAHVKWGGNWRIPTKDELEELRTQCTWTITTLNGVKGYTVTSNVGGYTDRSIFMPATGMRIRQWTLSTDTIGRFWGNSREIEDDSNEAVYLDFNFSRGPGRFSIIRCFGQCVRPVCP